MKISNYIYLVGAIVLSLVLSLTAFKYNGKIINFDTSRLIDSQSVQTPIRYIESKTSSKGYITSPPKTAATYAEAMLNIKTKRKQHLKDYKQAINSDKKAEVLNNAREDFTTSLATLLPYWYGTPWDFNGTSDTPQQGKIACGYYVTTVLEDVGFKIERNKLAQQASENIIKTLTDDSHIKRYSNKTLAEFNESLDSWGEGIYVVGLDYHVGYIWHDGTKSHFIHSTVIAPQGVLSEPAISSSILANSKYRVLGKISEDDDFILKWLEQTNLPTKV